jgi:ATP/ADP translocase
VHLGEVVVLYVRAYGWFVAALIWCLVLLVAAARFT